MFHVSPLRVPGMIALAAVVAAVCGCGASGRTGQAATSPAGTNAMSAYTPAQLRGALLPAVNGVKPAVPVESGAYGSLPGVKATRQSLSGVKITPANCASATPAGLSSPRFARVPATVATFRVGRDGLSEVLLAAPSSLAAQAVSGRPPADCSRYRARVGDRTFTYRIRVEKAPRLGEAARELNIRASGDEHADIWTIIYRSRGLLGAITLVGQSASRSAAESLARQAYEHAQKSLV